MSEFNTNISNVAVAQLLNELCATADVLYRDFNARKVRVSSHPDTVIGIRIPYLRKYAKRLAKHIDGDEAIAILQGEAQKCFEYKLLLGLILQESLPQNMSDAIALLYDLVDGWAVTDLYNEVLATFALNGYKNEVLSSILEYQDAINPFARRLTIVLFFPLLKHHLVTPDDALMHVHKMQNDTHYYVEMACAWLLTELTIISPNEVQNFLNHRMVTNPSVWKKYQQKLRDSYRNK